MEITVTWIFGLIVSAVTAYVSWSLKRFSSQAETDRNELKTIMQTHKTETQSLINEFDLRSRDEDKKLLGKIERLEEKLPEKYILKEDYYREINKLDRKIDNIKDELSSLNKNVAELVGKLGKI